MTDSWMDTFQRLVSEGETYLLLLPVYLGLLVSERIGHALLGRGRWDNRDAAANIFITGTVGLINLVIGHLLPIGVMAFLFEHARLFTLGDAWWGWALAFVLYDFCWYTDHRLGHRVGLFWAMHQVHHSSEEYNVTVASRGLVVDTTLLSRPLFYALPLLGVSPLQFLVVILATNVWGIAQHTRLVGKLPFFDWWFATPSNHRVHHGYNPEYIDRNYGEFLVVWDRLFGTYQPEGVEPTYGVIQPVGSYNPWTIQVAGFRWLAAKVRGATGWREKVRCLYLPPEWKPATESPGRTPSRL